MRVVLKSLECMHLEPIAALLSLQNTLTLMALFGFLDVHGYFSINDIQFWAFMQRSTDMPLRFIESLFFRLDYDYAGELKFSEFHMLCCCMIAAKDRSTKQFLQRHFNMLVSIIDKGHHSYLTIREFCMMGSIMGWDLGTLDRLYKYWDKSFEGDRYRIKLQKVELFILFVIDHERSTQARRRVKCLKDFKKRWLLNLEDSILDYYRNQALPAPPLLWKEMTGVEPPILKPPKEVEEGKGCCEYCIYGCGIFMILPWYIGYKLFTLPYKYVPCYRKTVNAILHILVCRCFWACCSRCCEKKKVKHPLDPEIPMDSAIFYNRNRRKIKTEPVFRYLQKQREVEGIFQRIDPWTDPWLRGQLHLEKLENQLIKNRIKGVEHERVTVQDTPGVEIALRNTYITKNERRVSTYKKYVPPVFDLPSRKKSVITVNTDAPLQAHYPTRFLDNYTPEEIARAENQVREAEFSRKGRRVETKALRETVQGKKKIVQKQAVEQERRAAQQMIDENRAGVEELDK